MAGLTDRGMLARPGARLGRSLPVPLWAHCHADVRAFKLLSRRAGTRGQPQMPMNAMVAITRTEQAAAPVTESRHAGFAARGGCGVSQLGLVLSISPVTALSLSSQCDLSSRED